MNAGRLTRWQPFGTLIGHSYGFLTGTRHFHRGWYLQLAATQSLPTLTRSTRRCQSRSAAWLTTLSLFTTFLGIGCLSGRPLVLKKRRLCRRFLIHSFYRTLGQVD